MAIAPSDREGQGACAGSCPDEKKNPHDVTDQTGTDLPYRNILDTPSQDTGGNQEAHSQQKKAESQQADHHEKV